MANFIGDRVKILYSETWPELNGTLGTIVEIDTDDGNPIIACDLWGGKIFHPADVGNPYFVPDFCQLEFVGFLSSEEINYEYDE